MKAFLYAFVMAVLLCVGGEVTVGELSVDSFQFSNFSLKTNGIAPLLDK